VTLSTTTAATTLQAEIDTLMADVVQYDGTAFSGLTYALGRRSIPEHASPPRVVFVLVSGTPQPAQKHSFPGGRRSLLTRALTLQALCWGADTDAALALSSAVLAAAQRRWGGRIAFAGEQWAEEPAVTDLGELVTLNFALQVAVLDRAPSLRTIATATPDSSAAVQGDGTLTVGETT
jgi:hypothetical protein